MKTKHAPTRQSEEFAFEQTDEGRGSFTYRCLEFDIETPSGEFTESELGFWKDVIRTLNINYPREQ